MYSGPYRKEAESFEGESVLEAVAEYEAQPR
jgi:hypothetical protein